MEEGRANSNSNHLGSLGQERGLMIAWCSEWNAIAGQGSSCLSRMGWSKPGGAPRSSVAADIAERFGGGGPLVPTWMRFQINSQHGGGRAESCLLSLRCFQKHGLGERP